VKIRRGGGNRETRKKVHGESGGVAGYLDTKRRMRYREEEVEWIVDGCKLVERDRSVDGWINPKRRRRRRRDWLWMCG
jgi:hypothetical protein